jgi:ACS family tartrate transporter-like MFS transporter
MKGPFLTIVSSAFPDKNAAAGIALVTTLGNLSGFAAPYMVGIIIDSTGSYRPGLAALGVQSMLGALIMLRWRRVRDVNRRECVAAAP